MSAFGRKGNQMACFRRQVYTGSKRIVKATIFRRQLYSGDKSNKNGPVSFEVFTVVTMKNGVFWDVMPCGSCKNRRFGGT
jgi:hypothetical protein